jgi:hypothetical protein
MPCDERTVQQLRHTVLELAARVAALEQQQQQPPPPPPPLSQQLSAGAPADPLVDDGSTLQLWLVRAAMLCVVAMATCVTVLREGRARRGAAMARETQGADEDVTAVSTDTALPTGALLGQWVSEQEKAWQRHFPSCAPKSPPQIACLARGFTALLVCRIGGGADGAEFAEDSGSVPNSPEASALVSIALLPRVLSLPSPHNG